jgi:hypothetical protein
MYFAQIILLHLFKPYKYTGHADLDTLCMCCRIKWVVVPKVKRWPQKKITTELDRRRLATVALLAECQNKCDVSTLRLKKCTIKTKVSQFGHKSKKLTVFEKKPAQLPLAISTDSRSHINCKTPANVLLPYLSLLLCGIKHIFSGPALSSGLPKTAL